MLWALQSCSPHCETWYWCFRLARKAFHSTIFPIINVHLWNETNLDTHYYLHSFRYGHCDHVLQIGEHDIDALDLQEKILHSTIYPIINVHLWNERNLDTYYNLYSFRYGCYNHVLHIRIHGIDALDLQEKLFFPPFFQYLIFICEMRQTWILIIISILLIMGTTIMFSLLRYMILMLWICKKCFSLDHFPYN